MGIERKCAECGETFEITRDNAYDAAYYEGKTYHWQCFEDACKRRSQSGNRAVAEKWGGVLAGLDAIRRKSVIHFLNFIDRDNVYRLIQDSYGIAVIPTTVFQKLNDIYKGTYKGMSRGIPPSHLYDMWQRKMNFLDGLAESNRAKGREMPPESRVLYDLSVLVNKYDGYLKWLARQELLEADIAEGATPDTGRVIRGIVEKAQAIKSPRGDSDGDISSLVDEVFG